MSGDVGFSWRIRGQEHGYKAICPSVTLDTRWGLPEIRSAGRAVHLLPRFLLQGSVRFPQSKRALLLVLW